MPAEQISLSILENIGLLPNGDSVVTPNQKDIFSDFSNPLNDISGDLLKKELNDKANQSKVEDKKKETVDKVDKKEEGTEDAPKAAAAIPTLDTIAEEASKLVTNKPAAEIAGQETADEKKLRIRTGTVNYLKNKIEKGEFQTYNDFDETKQTLEEYLEAMPEKDRQEMIDKNYEIRQEKFKEDYQSEFYNSLPGHLKFVVKHLVDGTLDPQNIYAALSRVEQTQALDPSDENDQEAIAYNYLQATKFGTQNEIEAQVSEWKELKLLEKKAIQFKPKLDKMGEQQVAAYAEQAERVKADQQKAAEWYADSVEQALKDGDLNGLKLNKKQQAQLYNDLLLDIKPSVRDGRPMNKLWQRLEHIQVVEPDFKLLAEVNYLVSNPKEYREALIQQGRNEATGKIAKELKTTQGSGADRGSTISEPQVKKGIIKQKYNPFDTIK